MGTVQKHPRAWTQEDVFGMSDLSIEIMLEEINDFNLPTAVVDIIYLDAVKIFQGEFRGTVEAQGGLNKPRAREYNSGWQQGQQEKSSTRQNRFFTTANYFFGI